jgi:hypothetical protein
VGPVYKAHSSASIKPTVHQAICIGDCQRGCRLDFFLEALRQLSSGGGLRGKVKGFFRSTLHSCLIFESKKFSHKFTLSSQREDVMTSDLIPLQCYDLGIFGIDFETTFPMLKGLKMRKWKSHEISKVDP